VLAVGAEGLEEEAQRIADNYLRFVRVYEDAAGSTPVA
jgi:hypothetical protein